MPISQMSVGKMYEVDVIDYNTGDLIKDVREISVSSNGMTSTLPVTNGMAYFNPSKGGYYAFSIEKNDDGYMNGYSSTFFVNSAGHKSSLGLYIGVSILILIALAFILFKKGYVKLPSFGEPRIP